MSLTPAALHVPDRSRLIAVDPLKVIVLGLIAEYLEELFRRDRLHFAAYLRYAGCQPG